MARWLLACMLLWGVAAQAQRLAPLPDDEETARVAEMTLEDKLSQLFMVSWPQWGVPEAWLAALREGKVSGVLLSPGVNYLLPDELDALTAAAREANASAHPLLFAAPCEGGLRSLLHPELGGAPVPEAAALGALGDAAVIKQAYTRLGADFKRHGIHLALGPALGYTPLDTDATTDARAFGTSPQAVTEAIRAAVAGIAAGGALATPVAFPAMDALTKGRVLDLDAATDRVALCGAAVESGAGGMAVSTVRIPSLDKETPAGLSGPAVRETLQGKLGFGGLVISPDVTTREAFEESGEERAAEMALRAGCDLVWITAANPEELEERREQVREAIEKERLPIGRVDEAVRRVLLTKRRAGAGAPPPPTTEPADDAPVPNGVVIVRDEPGMLPLRAVGAKYLVVSPETSWTTMQGVEIFNGATLGTEIREVVEDAVDLRVSLLPTPTQRANALREAGQADILVIGMLQPKVYTAQRQLVDELMALGKPTVLVQLGDAAGLESFANAPVQVAANGYSPPALDAAARVLFGEEKPGGKLPAPIGRLFPAGHAGP